MMSSWIGVGTPISRVKSFSDLAKAVSSGYLNIPPMPLISSEMLRIACISLVGADLAVRHIIQRHA